MKKLLLLITVIVLGMSFSGCGIVTNGVDVTSSVKPFSSEEAQQFSSIKKIAVLPFDNLTKEKDVEQFLSGLLITRILKQNNLFDSVEEVRYVANVMKMLKIKRTQILDRDLVLKMGETMRCEAVLVGEINAYNIGKKDESTDISINATLLDTRSGDILWTANVTKSSSTSWGKVFGVTPGPNHIEMAKDVVDSLVSSLSHSVRKIREEESSMEVDKKLLEEPAKAPAEEGAVKGKDEKIPPPVQAPDEPEVEIQE